MSSKPESEATKVIKIFVSYSRKDEKQKEQLLSHLSPLIRKGAIKSWDDQQIRAGEEWNEEILKHFDEADMILCLISANFISSDYCYTVEMRRAWERREAEDVKIIPILLKTVVWQETPFYRLLAIPRDGKAIMDRSNRDKAFAEVAKEISKVVDSLSTRSA